MENIWRAPRVNVRTQPLRKSSRSWVENETRRPKSQLLRSLTSRMETIQKCHWQYSVFKLHIWLLKVNWKRGRLRRTRQWPSSLSWFLLSLSSSCHKHFVAVLAGRVGQRLWKRWIMEENAQVNLLYWWPSIYRSQNSYNFWEIFVDGFLQIWNIALISRGVARICSLMESSFY